jgi:integrase
MFAWGVSEEMLPAAVHQALKTVPALRKGRSKAAESSPVLPVPEEDYLAALAEMTSPVAALCRVLYHTGMRVSEARLMAWDDIDRTVSPWRYDLPQHKTTHHGKQRVVFLGPQAQMVLRPYLADRGFVFRSSEMMNRPYTLHGLEAGIGRTCADAGVDRWSPGRLRHNFATNVNAQYDADAARCVLGHSEVSTTMIYAERDFRRAAEIAAAVA